MEINANKLQGQTQVQALQMLDLFKSNIPSSRYIFKDGTVANFTQGIYTTSIQEYIKELDTEILKGHPHISRESGRAQVSLDELDPVSVMKKKLKAEILAEMAIAAGNPDRDMGSSTQDKNAGVVTSAGISSMAAGSASGSPSIAAGSIKVASK